MDPWFNKNTGDKLSQYKSIYPSLCLRKREGEREGEREREREGGGGRERERERQCVCVCERESLCVRVFLVHRAFGCRSLAGTATMKWKRRPGSIVVFGCPSLEYFKPEPPKP